MIITLVSLLQSLYQEILGRQAELDEVKNKAQALLESNPDASVSRAITQLATKYQALVSLSKVLTFYYY